MLNTLQSYLNNQSDAIDSNGCLCLIKLTNDLNEHFELIHHLLNCISTSCILNEKNRQFYVNNGLCENLMKIFNNHKLNNNILCEACTLIRNILLDDDIRVEFSNSHEHAKFIASNLNGIDSLLSIGLGKYFILILLNY